jgi:NADH-quinone oxidoreductase subunit N
MNSDQILALMPIIVLSLCAVVLMLQTSVRRNAKVAWNISALGLIAAIWGAGYSLDLTSQVTPLIIIDRWGLMFTTLILIASMVTLLLSREGFSKQQKSKEEYYLLLILAVLGAVVLIHSSHVATLLLGMELMGIALYAMIAFPEKGNLSLEAAIKYLVLSACASAMLLFGFALLYAATGDLSYVGMASKAAIAYADNPALIMAGTALVISGVCFKLSVVPFHMWTPDVYQGAPTPVTGFLATVSKGAVFVAFTRIFVGGNLAQYDNLVVALTVVAIASMLVGNLLALRQDDVKRMLSYSSIAHFGYLLIVLIAAPALGIMAYQAISFYLIAYIVTSLAAFTVLTAIAGEDETANHISAFEGLFWRSPVQAAALTVAMLSLAGIPLTAGFIGKFYIINASIEGAQWALLTALVVGSAIAIYYYLKVIFAMSKIPEDKLEHELASKPRNLSYDFLAAAMLALVLYIGSWPQPVMAFIAGL